MKRFFLVIFFLIAATLGALFFLSKRTVIALDPVPKAIGVETPLKLRLSNPHGVRRVVVGVEQGGARHVVLDQSEPVDRWLFLRGNKPPRDFPVTVGAKRIPALKTGKAKLFVETVSNDLRGESDAVALDVDVITEPPRLAVDGFQHYINQGGAEMVVFTVTGAWSEAGVRVGQHQFRSFPLPGSTSGQRFSLFAFPWDTPANAVPIVYAKDGAGGEVTSRFWFKTFPKPFRARDLELDDPFIEKVTAELDPGGSGDPLARFLKINGDMRRKNNQTLADLRFKTEEKFLWTEPFAQLANSKVESQFADRRTYLYKGKKVDQQVHLGFDLSVTKNIPVVAANSGNVIYAAPLGIYGNCVVIDHGYGLQSIYAHLSSIDVKPGDPVKKSQPIGKSGATGLAGGDHLHFSMQVDGVQINPVEWWDDHWITDRVRSKLSGGS